MCSIKYLQRVFVPPCYLNMADYIPLVTDDYRIAFCQATACLPNDIQRIIWVKTLELSRPENPPPAPLQPSPRLARLMAGWKARRQLEFGDA